ncbi:MAG TPA: hypothetical protein VIV27_06210 [Halioglobus sp.]
MVSDIVFLDVQSRDFSCKGCVIIVGLSINARSGHAARADFAGVTAREFALDVDGLRTLEVRPSIRWINGLLG